MENIPEGGCRAARENVGENYSFWMELLDFIFMVAACPVGTRKSIFRWLPGSLVDGSNL